MLAAAEFLYNFSSDNEYTKNLQILTTYLGDITNCMLQYKESAEQSAEMIHMLNKALDMMPKDHKRKIKDVIK